MTTTEVLLFQCIDYAGLFPPARLDLHATVENYAQYRAGAQAWALGRLILPANRATEFTESWPSYAALWPISLLLNDDADELHHVIELGLFLDVVECKPMPVEKIGVVRRLLPEGTTVYFEVPVGAGTKESIAAIANVGGRAKVRMGGVTREAIPSGSDFVNFLSHCMEQRVSFKATAGLHHPIRSVHPLTYEPQSDHALMHGFVNVILAAAILKNGGGIAEVSAVLEDASPQNFTLGQEHIQWRDWSFTVQQITDVRRDLMVSFGSCSFTEPLAEIKSLELPS